ncbi:MAG: xanthine dehydrogenase family protein [Acidobacteria bacterium]|nr:xanthine dehydrogenase family protein [Acidobacteriota bacterium]
MSRPPAIGRAVPRREGRAKVTGQARYVDDLTLPGMLHGVTVRSPHPRGTIRHITFDDGIPWDEITIVTAADIPGKNVVTLITEDQPYLADGRVNHAEEPILLLAHADRHLLEEARRRITIDIDPLPAVMTIDDALDGEHVIWGTDNIFKSYVVGRGDVDARWREGTASIVEGQYETGAQEQLYIEPNGMLAVADSTLGVTVWGSMQCPYYIHKALIGLFALPAGKIRVVQMETGGGFGGKEEYPSIIAGHAALLAWKSGRPVKLIYDRAEDMAATTKRHPSRTRITTGVDATGRLVAMDIDFVIDGGAYCTLSPVVLSRGTIHASGPYFCPNIRVRGRAVATSVPPHGAFRGFGAPQSIFGLERHMDRAAAAAGLSPEDFRRVNFIKPGQTSAVGQVMRDPVDMNAILDRALSLSDYHEKRQRFDAERSGPVRKGIGFATFMHGAGFTGSGEEHLASIVTVEVTGEDRVRVLTASTEIGQGTITIFSQIAADALGIDVEDVDIVQPDTAVVPNSGPTVASRTCMIVGKLVESAAQALRRTLADVGLPEEGYSRDEFHRKCRIHVERHGSLRASAQYTARDDVKWNDETYEGDAYGSYAWAAYVAEVSVDMATFEIHVDDFVAVQEVGKVINPVLATGQIEGGVAQAIGWALYEDVVWREGRMANAQMTNYIMPTSADLPSIRVFFEEVPYPHGPAGAKGIGELPMDGPAPAIANAVAHATGVDVRRIPLTPEALAVLVEAAIG